ncbi:MAG: hypothetical protein RQ875_04010 [Vicingaceae bacterium]|nr:hypothetical protein [Vicingaceae bacterium]
MNTSEKIEYNKERDFSETLSASVVFIRQIFKPLISAILLLAGPLLLLNAILISIYTHNIFNFNDLSNNNNLEMLASVFSPVYFLVILFSILSGILIIGIVYETMALYEKYPTEKITVATIWYAILKDIKLLFSTFFYLLGILFIFGIALSLVMLVFFALGVAGITIFMFLFFIAMLIFGPQILFFISAIYPIRIRERVSNSFALNKSYQLVKNNFWNTWLVIFVSYLIIMILGLFFSLPQSIYTGASQLHNIYDGGFNQNSSVMLTVFNVIAILGTNIVNAILYIIIGFHYFSSNEKVFGVGLAEKIETIGNSTEDNEDITI